MSLRLSTHNNGDDFQAGVRSLTATSLFGGAQSKTSRVEMRRAGTMVMTHLVVRKASPVLADPA